MGCTIERSVLVDPVTLFVLHYQYPMATSDDVTINIKIFTVIG